MAEPGHVMQVQRVSKRFGAHLVLKGLSFVTTPGRVLVVRGRNGSGKTTLLRCLAGEAPMDAGTIWLDGRVQDTCSVGYWIRVYGVLDDFSWFPELTVGDHLQLLDNRVDPAAALARFDAEDLVDRTAVSLSSGQARRATLATVLVRPWQVLLLDEPEQRLDGAGLSLLARVVDALSADGKVVIMSTHSETLARMVDSDVLSLD